MGKSIPDSTGGSNVLIKVLKRVEGSCVEASRREDADKTV